MNTEGTEGSQRDAEGVTVRAAQAGDLEGVLRVERGLGTAVHWVPSEYERILGADGVVRRCLVVAEVEGRVIGFGVGMVAGDLGELESVAVEEEWQRRGVGRALCDAVLGWCWGEGAASVALEVRAGSLGARRVYEALGFREVGRRPGYYEEPGEDAILMRVDRRDCAR